MSKLNALRGAGAIAGRTSSGIIINAFSTIWDKKLLFLSIIFIITIFAEVGVTVLNNGFYSGAVVLGERFGNADDYVYNKATLIEENNFNIPVQLRERKEVAGTYIQRMKARLNNLKISILEWKDRVVFFWLIIATLWVWGLLFYAIYRLLRLINDSAQARWLIITILIILFVQTAWNINEKPELIKENSITGFLSDYKEWIPFRGVVKLGYVSAKLGSPIGEFAEKRFDYGINETKLPINST